jgi:hypothetical protein
MSTFRAILVSRAPHLTLPILGPWDHSTPRLKTCHETITFFRCHFLGVLHECYNYGAPLGAPDPNLTIRGSLKCIAYFAILT